jgi:hypothetical protein
MWRTAGAQQVLQLLILAPLAYRLRQGSKLLYREPGYLICTDPELDPRQMIEAYFQRWDIEVNFRDEKTLLGVGQAQVTAEASVESVPALTVAAYGMMLVSAESAFGNSGEGLLPQPKWAASSGATRTSTQQILHQLRAEGQSRGRRASARTEVAFPPAGESVGIPRRSRRPEGSHPVKGIRGPTAGQKPRPTRSKREYAVLGESACPGLCPRIKLPLLHGRGSELSLTYLAGRSADSGVCKCLRYDRSGVESGRRTFRRRTLRVVMAMMSAPGAVDSLRQILQIG